MEVDGQFRVACADAAEFLQPAHALLHDAALTIGHPIKGYGGIPPGGLIVFVGYHRLYLLPPEPLAQGFGTVALVAGNLPGLAATSTSLAAAPD